MALLESETTATENGKRKSDRVVIVSRDLSEEDLSMILDASIAAEAKAFNHEYPGPK